MNTPPFLDPMSHTQPPRFKDRVKVQPNQSPQDTQIRLKLVSEPTLDASDYVNFIKLENLLLKIFLNEQITLPDLEISNIEEQIVRRILIRKNMISVDEAPFSCESLNIIRVTSLEKKTEDELKFVLKKCIKHLQDRFVRNLKLRGQSIASGPGINYKNQLDLEFYTAYFGHISRDQNKPIECFFHFRSWKRRYSMHIPKSITKNSLGNWKENPVFIAEIKEYIHSEFDKWTRQFNVNKIRKLVSKWGKTFERNGRVKGMEMILHSFEKKGCKLPWTAFEIDSAVETTKKHLA